jgi:AcrR family transcriptional regulator
MRSVHDRLCDAMLDLVLSEGYDGVRVEDLIERAEVGRDEFDRLFASKEECAIATFDRSFDRYRQSVRAAYDSEPEWVDALRAAAYASAQWFVEHPRDVRFGILGLLWASEMAQVRREAALREFVAMIDAGRRHAPDPDSIPPYTAEGVIGSYVGIMTKRMPHEDIDPRGMVPELMYIAVRPYLGEDAAQRELAMPPPRSVG